jgi:hypothetical protein
MKGAAPDLPAALAKKQNKVSFQCSLVLPSVHSCSGTRLGHDSSISLILFVRCHVVRLPYAAQLAADHSRHAKTCRHAPWGAPRPRELGRWLAPIGKMSRPDVVWCGPR